MRLLGQRAVAPAGSSEPPGGEAISAAVRNASMRAGKSEGENRSSDQDAQSRGSRHVADPLKSTGVIGRSADWGNWVATRWRARFSLMSIFGARTGSDFMMSLPIFHASAPNRLSPL
jgi:hypothetical protein